MIREATPSDIDKIFNLALEFHEKAETVFPVDRVATRRTISMFVHSQKYFAWIKEVDGDVLGVLLGGTAPVWFSTVKEASDLIFYVKSDPRAIGAGKFLLKKFLKWGKEKDVAGFSMAVTFGGNTITNTGKIFRKLGFKHVGGVYYLQF